MRMQWLRGLSALAMAPLFGALPPPQAHILRGSDKLRADGAIGFLPRCGVGSSLPTMHQESAVTSHPRASSSSSRTPPRGSRSMAAPTAGLMRLSSALLKLMAPGEVQRQHLRVRRKPVRRSRRGQPRRPHKNPSAMTWLRRSKRSPPNWLMMIICLRARQAEDTAARARPEARYWGDWLNMKIERVVA